MWKWHYCNCCSVGRTLVNDQLMSRERVDTALLMRKHVSLPLRPVFFICERYAQFVDNVSAWLVSALVLSRLDYCNAVLPRFPATTLSPLHTVLNAAARFVLDLKPRDYVISTLRELHWLPMGQWIEYKLCLLICKTLIGHSSDYMYSHLSPTCHHASRCVPLATANLFLPRTERQLGDRAYSLSLHPARGISYRQNWHSCARRHSITTFKHHLKTIIVQLSIHFPLTIQMLLFGLLLLLLVLFGIVYMQDPNTANLANLRYVLYILAL